MKNITVYCSSSDILSENYFRTAQETGMAIGNNTYTLMYGGGNTGLMGCVAKYTHKHKGNVIGVIPEAMEKIGLAYTKADKLIVTADMYERKKYMSTHADAFITLPGGFGTLEEVLDVITQKQLHIHEKPIIFINTSGYYNKLIEMFDVIFKEKATNEIYRNLYYVTESVEDAFEYLKTYTPLTLPKKWIKKEQDKNIAESSPI